jgi:hypothetical protein
VIPSFTPATAGFAIEGIGLADPRLGARAAPI